MIPNVGIDELASRLKARNSPQPQGGQAPFILFIGSGCARAARVPSTEEIARTALSLYGKLGNEELDSSALVQRFSDFTEQLSHAEMARMLNSIFAKLPIPSFYQDLGLLVREGYFPLIFTTNFDTLLEQALGVSGVRSGEYRVATIGSRRRISSEQPVSQSSSKPLTHLVKLHGDLSQGTVQLLPSEIEDALQSSRRWIKADLMGDIVMVGHELSDDPLDSWLAHSNNRELWWVSPDPPSDGQRARSWAQEYHEILQNVARPEIFFSQLVLRLLRSTSVDDAFTPNGMPQSLSMPDEGLGMEEGAELNAAQLTRELVRAQAVLRSLEQESPPGDRPSHIQAQVDYQKQCIVKLEDKLRELPEVQPKVHELIGLIQADLGAFLQRGQTDSLHSAVEYINGQVSLLRFELEKPQPNQLIVSGTLGATLTMADRLVTEYGGRAASLNNLKNLASILPSAASKVLL